MARTDKFGVHECLHMAHFFAESVESQLVEHDAIKADPEWAALAERASSALRDLYHSIGKKSMA